VLVYGQPDLIDPVREYGFPSPLAAITSYCGYVVTPALERRRAVLRPYKRPPRVLATAGEGEDGFPVLEAFVAAAARTGWNATVVAGAHSPKDRRGALRALAADAGVQYRKFVAGLPSEFANLDALVCMGGYNTLAEAAACGVPTVCVPRSEPTRDQLIRARAFESRGLLRIVPREELDPDLLRAEVETTLAEAHRDARPALDLGGDRRAAHHLLEVAMQRPSRTTVDVPALEVTAHIDSVVAASG
jgi:predicted glycosyltransferase